MTKSERNDEPVAKRYRNSLYTAWAMSDCIDDELRRIYVESVGREITEAQVVSIDKFINIILGAWSVLERIKEGIQDDKAK
jgi:small nuclear ribonucleoprotein (snRNP)-like protein